MDPPFSSLTSSIVVIAVSSAIRTSKACWVCPEIGFRSKNTSIDLQAFSTAFCKTCGRVGRQTLSSIVYRVLDAAAGPASADDGENWDADNDDDDAITSSYVGRRDNDVGGRMAVKPLLSGPDRRSGANAVKAETVTTEGNVKKLWREGMLVAAMERKHQVAPAHVRAVMTL
jgi:hypothetical protein